MSLTQAETAEELGLMSRVELLHSPEFDQKTIWEIKVHHEIFAKCHTLVSERNSRLGFDFTATQAELDDTANPHGPATGTATPGR